MEGLGTRVRGPFQADTRVSTEVQKQGELSGIGKGRWLGSVGAGAGAAERGSRTVRVLPGGEGYLISRKSFWRIKWPLGLQLMGSSASLALLPLPVVGFSQQGQCPTRHSVRPLALPLACFASCNDVLLLVISLFMGSSMETLGPEDAECPIAVLLECRCECSRHCEVLWLPPCTLQRLLLLPLPPLYVLYKNSKHILKYRLVRKSWHKGKLEDAT